MKEKRSPKGGCAQKAILQNEPENETSLYYTASYSSGSPTANGLATRNTGLALAGQLHLEERQQQLPPVVNRAQDAIDLQTVLAVVHLQLLFAAPALE